MKKRIFVSMLLALTMVSGLFAETTQTLLINGEQVDKVVGSITFDGDNVVLHFDNETESYDMNLVSLVLDYNTGVKNLNLFTFNSKIEDGLLRVSGLDSKTHIYIFNLSGIVVKSAISDDNGETVIDVATLPGGIYILKADNNCVKFVKH